MPSNYTEHYQFSQWERSDKVLMDDFNADNAKIDAALAGKAEAAAVESLQKTVAGHTSALNGKGNCRICTVTYTGNGRGGADGAITLSFPGKPLLLFLVEPSTGIFSVMLNGSPYAVKAGSGSSMPVTWSGYSVSWYHRDGGHFNDNGRTYTAFALIALT